MKLLKVHRTTLYRPLKADLLHPVKLGGRTMFKEKDLNRFIRSLPPAKKA